MAIMITVVRTEVFRKVLNDIDDIEKAEEYVESTVFDDENWESLYELKDSGCEIDFEEV